MNESLKFRFPKSARLLKRRDYQRLAHGFKRHLGQWVIIDVRQGKPGQPKLGITVSKRYGNSPKRNRFKRIVREAFRLSQHLLPDNIEMNVKPRSLAIKAAMPDILKEIQALLLPKAN